MKSLALYALTSDGEMFVLKEATEGETALSPRHSGSKSESAKGVPRIPAALPARSASSHRPTKRRRVISTPANDLCLQRDKKLAVVNYGSMLVENGSAVPLQACELPSLTGGFARAFVGRNLA